MEQKKSAKKHSFLSITSLIKKHLYQKGDIPDGPKSVQSSMMINVHVQGVRLSITNKLNF